MKPAAIARRAGLSLCAAALLSAASPVLPVRGLHVMAPKSEEIPLAVRFIEEALPREGVNLLVLEVDYRYRFTSRPEIREADALSRDDLQKLAAACRKAGVKLVPQINLLGHQSWGKNTHALLRAHPEFDETPGRYPANEGIYCRSYCPLHPGVHAVMFDLMDELLEVTGADAFHAGLDEVFLLGEEHCPRCRGKNKAELFAGEVRAARDHLARSGRRLWIWGDRLLDGETTGMGKWEASMNQTHAALRLIPKDVVICDWHYEKAHPTAAYFAMEGFQVVSSPWRKPQVALGQLELMRSVRAHSSDEISGRMLGMLQTTWCGMGAFVKAYNGEAADARVLEAVRCFRELFRQIREQ
jgi:hypothetical protein